MLYGKHGSFYNTVSTPPPPGPLFHAASLSAEVSTDGEGMRPFKPGSCRRLQAQVKIMGFAPGALEQVHFTFGGPVGVTEEKL